jgi:hypothetical protein
MPFNETNSDCTSKCVVKSNDECKDFKDCPLPKQPNNKEWTYFGPTGRCRSKIVDNIQCPNENGSRIVSNGSVSSQKESESLEEDRCIIGNSRTIQCTPTTMCDPRTSPIPTTPSLCSEILSNVSRVCDEEECYRKTTDSCSIPMANSVCNEILLRAKCLECPPKPRCGSSDEFCTYQEVRCVKTT